MPLDDTNIESAIVADLRAGRAYIVINGWCQHQSRDGLRVCALGGIFAVTEGGTMSGIDDLLSPRARACDALQNTLDASLGEHGSLAWWNDQPERTVEDVLALYDLAIDRETAVKGFAI